MSPIRPLALYEPCYVYKVVEVVDVHDGDTYKLRIDLGFRISVVLIIRLHAYNCAELATQEGIVARAWVVEKLKAATSITVRSYKDEQSFARWVCDVFVDGELLGDLLLAAGLAVRM